MGFVVKRSSRMQEHFFLFSGGTGICSRAGLKKSGRGRNFAGEDWAPPGSDTLKVRWGGLSVRLGFVVGLLSQIKRKRKKEKKKSPCEMLNVECNTSMQLNNVMQEHSSLIFVGN
jgi:hypothetical protein